MRISPVNLVRQIKRLKKQLVTFLSMDGLSSAGWPGEILLNNLIEELSACRMSQLYLFL